MSQITLIIIMSRNEWHVAQWFTEDSNENYNVQSEMGRYELNGLLDTIFEYTSAVAS